MTLEQMPTDLPVPMDDGACDHLTGMSLPKISLTCTDNRSLNLSSLTQYCVIYIYPMTGRPDKSLPDGWETIPGARGCTPQSCGFRDLHHHINKYATVFGLSSQITGYQQEAKMRLQLPFELLSDSHFLLKQKLFLPTFTIENIERYKRVTLIIENNIIKKVFYPVFPPDLNAQDVLAWFESPA